MKEREILRERRKERETEMERERESLLLPSLGQEGAVDDAAAQGGEDERARERKR